MSDTNKPVILSLGMGVDSVAILVRWLLEPLTRNFDLRNLIVITAQVGNEFPKTKYLMERYLLPLLREHGVRWIQVSRGGRSQKDGILTISDTREPYVCHIEGNPDWTLEKELLAAGTVPQSAANNRRCSLKWKGFPLDTLIARELGGAEFRHVMGFNSDEMFRVERDSSYSNETRHSEYPLVDWDWGRKKCEDYLEEIFGEPWQKSCCTFCPFSNGKDDCMARYREDPDAAAGAMLMERVSLAMNHRMTLYGSKSMEGCVEKDGNDAALAKLGEKLDAEWAVYRVRRVYSKPARAERKIEVVSRGTREECESAVRGMAGFKGSEAEKNAEIVRARVVERVPDVYPAYEESYVAAPAVVEEKSRGKFEEKWAGQAA